MPRPNIDNTDVLLFQCRCHGDTFLELWLDPDDKDYVSFHCIDYPPTLWQCLVWWWKHKKLWAQDIILSQSDMVALRDALIKYTEYEKESDKEEVGGKEGKEAEAGQAS